MKYSLSQIAAILNAAYPDMHLLVLRADSTIRVLPIIHNLHNTFFLQPQTRLSLHLRHLLGCSELLDPKQSRVHFDFTAFAAGVSSTAFKERFCRGSHSYAVALMT